MKKKLTQLTIRRDKWARGGLNGQSKLLNERGFMCCLGFMCRALGFKKEEIKWSSPGFIKKIIFSF